MTHWFVCPYLGTDVEFTDERQRYVLGKHDIVGVGEWRLIEQTLREPEEIRRSRTDANALVFLRWYDDFERGKYVAVVVIDERGQDERQWIITAYVTDKPRRGEVVWRRT